MRDLKSKFNIVFNKTLFIIEEYLDTFNNKNDIDYEINNQMMTITFSKKNKIIISKQEIYQQLWLATKCNGYHFNYINNNWICNRTRKNFWNILDESFYIQSKEKTNFSKKFLNII
ncbi:iron donor protein CyaY [Buchnera aphidicola]|uniref:iron donor protein CyaY n=1 Tax=Buchnera aphidicola TaxID=9 RepID=UPI003464523B